MVRRQSQNLQSSLAAFYANRNVLITGSSGFIGTLLIEKLLRSCPDIGKIYLIIRVKKGVAPKDRLAKLFSDKVFDRLRNEQPNFEEKCIPILGDISNENLGLNFADRDLLIQEVDIVFHCGANVKMLDSLKTSVNANIRGLREMLHLCEEMKHLKCVIHVSTAYSYAPQRMIEEVFYDPPYDPETIINFVNGLDEQSLKSYSKTLLTQKQRTWPNVYSFTKAIAEDLIRQKHKTLPVALFRPSAVLHTLKEPMEAWCDNPHGSFGVAAMIHSGLIHAIPVNGKLDTNAVPGDYCINGLIAIAEHVAREFEQQVDLRNVIFNYVTKKEKSLKNSDYIKKALCSNGDNKYPLKNAVDVSWVIATPCKYWYYILDFIFHLIPILFIDLHSKLTGQKAKMFKIYKSFSKVGGVLSYFHLNEWIMFNDNVCQVWNNLNEADKDIFPFYMDDFDFDSYAALLAMGLKRDIAKDKMDEESLKADRKRYEKLKKRHQITLVGFYILCVIFIYYVYIFLKNSFNSVFGVY